MIAMNGIKEFIYAALPWVAMGLLVVILAVRSTTKQNPKDEFIDNYGTEGMCLGMCFGTAIGAIFCNDTGLGISLGMLVGLAMGSCVRKENKQK